MCHARRGTATRRTQSKPYTLKPETVKFKTRNLRSETSQPKPRAPNCETRNPKPEIWCMRNLGSYWRWVPFSNPATRNPKLGIQTQKPEIQNQSNPELRNPKFETRNPNPEFRNDTSDPDTCGIRGVTGSGTRSRDPNPQNRND